MLGPEHPIRGNVTLPLLDMTRPFSLPLVCHYSVTVFLTHAECSGHYPLFHLPARFPLEFVIITPLHRAISGVDNLLGMRFPKHGWHHLKCKAYAPGPFSLVDPTLVIKRKHEVANMPDGQYLPPGHLQDCHGTPERFPACCGRVSRSSNRSRRSNRAIERRWSESLSSIRNGRLPIPMMNPLLSLG